MIERKKKNTNERRNSMRLIESSFSFGFVFSQILSSLLSTPLLALSPPTPNTLETKLRKNIIVTNALSGITNSIWTPERLTLTMQKSWDFHDLNTIRFENKDGIELRKNSVWTLKFCWSKLWFLLYESNAINFVSDSSFFFISQISLHSLFSPVGKTTQSQHIT